MDAILLLDFQNEFVKPGGKLHDDVALMLSNHGTVGNVTSLVATSRSLGVHIIHSPVIMKIEDKLKGEVDPHAYGAMHGLFTEGTWNSAFADEVHPRPEDTVLKNRNNFNAFSGTELEDVLSGSKGIKRLFIAGFLTNMCIQETTTYAAKKFGHKLKIHVLSDGCAAKSEEEHNHALNTVLKKHSEVITTTEAKRLLKASNHPTITNIVPTGLGNINIASYRHTSNYRPRILALHGARSNREVTKIQLVNLDITDKDYDIIYINGNVNVEHGDPDLDGMILGPFYSWFDSKSKEAFGKSLIAAVHDVLLFSKNKGPFDGIFGFSSGAIVSAMVAGIHSDLELKEAVLKHGSRGNKRFSLLPSRNADVTNNLDSNYVNGLVRQGSMRSRRASKTTFNTSSRGFSKRGFSKRGFNLDTKNDFDGHDSGKLVAGDLSQSPFRFIIAACAASQSEITTIRKYAGLSGPLPIYKDISSYHLVGIEDDFKSQSEQVALFFTKRFISYLPGGHGVGRDSADEELTTFINEYIKVFGDTVLKDKPDYVRMSEASSVSLIPNSQVAIVKLDQDVLPEGTGGATIKAALSAQPAKNPFLVNARATEGVTTYGDVLDFVNGGEGDLRRLGVKQGEVVAYGAPPGGGAPAALAFLSIAAQTATAPLDSTMTKTECLDALDQFSVRHLILFDDVSGDGVVQAFAEYEEKGKAKLHKATIVGGNRPGMFRYLKSAMIEGEPLSNPADGIGLLLRTSGTTARPKGVPLLLGALVTNGAILAKSMQLTKQDVCYSIMPLFHIGGISASILCTLTSGGVVCCDGESYNPERMVDALALSKPQPTWYSSVPTIHNATVAFLKEMGTSNSAKHIAYGIDANGVWKTGHSLRMIRSGAAALLGPDGTALAESYGGVPIYPTYSMSEQMPISQPPAGKGDTLTTKSGSVGVPVAASTAIVSRANLRPQPPGVEGEISISGPTVLSAYLDNPDADRKSYFYLTLPFNGKNVGEVHEGRYFLTGDVGVIDSDGFLCLKGRAKELIKKGGEQVSPFEVEAAVLEHPWVLVAVCFSVPSELYGEEVGCAIVLSPEAPKNPDLRDVIKAVRIVLKEVDLATVKFPTKWKICEDDELPKTKTKKYKRIGLAKVLGFDEDEVCPMKEKATKAKMDWDAIGGFRFMLACYVMFMHIGANASWGAVSNLRGFTWHVHAFFTLGGYSMAAPMNPTITKKFQYFLARFWGMYPMYFLAISTMFINLIVACRPSTFSPNFHWDSQPNDLYLDDGSRAPLFCEGTPAFKTSYWGSLIMTVVIYTFGLAITPIWPLAWFMGYYAWFSSMYYQCLMIFPATYNYVYTRCRNNAKLILKLIIGLLVLDMSLLVVAWFIIRGCEGYNHYDKETGEKNPSSDYTMDGLACNVGVLSWFLFSPLWMLYFIVGVLLAFLYDAVRPTEQHNLRMWGWIADGCALTIFAISMAQIGMGGTVTAKDGTVPTDIWYMRPQQADNLTDPSAVNRLWDEVSGRFAAPIITLWIFSVSTGQGYFTKLLRNKFLVEELAPNAYNCFLFHQQIGQWYYAITRQDWWYWWGYRKTMFWFSPKPCPVEWYEWFYVVGIVVTFSRFLTRNVEPHVNDAFDWLKAKLFGMKNEDEVDTLIIIFNVIEGMTGIEPQDDWTLEECGLASIGVPALIRLLNTAFSSKTKALTITAADLITAETIGELADVVDMAIALRDAQGV